MLTNDFVKIIEELESMGNYNIKFFKSGNIHSRFGKDTYNTWQIQNGKLVNVECKMR